MFVYIIEAFGFGSTWLMFFVCQYECMCRIQLQSCFIFLVSLGISFPNNKNDRGRKSLNYYCIYIKLYCFVLGGISSVSNDVISYNSLAKVCECVHSGHGNFLETLQTTLCTIDDQTACAHITLSSHFGLVTSVFSILFHLK